MIFVFRLVLLASFGLASLRAGSRYSANYTVSTEILDTAGEAATSQSYRNTPSLGGCASPAAATGHATVQPGFVVQLAPVTRLALTANGTSLAETGTSQLAAWEILADATRAALAPAAVTWSVASGPILINSAGLVTATPVYQDSAAVAAADYAGFTAALPLTVLNTASDNFGSYANDGLPDDWQTLYFGIANPNAVPGRDPDHDGYSNAFEYAAGFDPTSAASRFSFVVQPVPGQSAQRRIIFDPRFESSTYTVEATTDLSHWFPLTSFTTTDAGTQRIVTDLAATQANKIYRVAVTATGLGFSYANDNLPDDWQTRYFGVANPNAAPGRDPDHDGFDNFFEYAAGLDPTDAASRFSLTTQPVPGQPAQRRILFNPRNDGATYTVEASTDLSRWNPLTNFTTTDSGTQRIVTDLAATESLKFYRIVITATGLGFSYASDGIPDDWQTIHFGVANPSGAPARDPDHDGFDNAFEYAAGLDPTDPASRLTLTLEAVPGQPTQRRLTFSPRYDPATYTVETSTNLSQWTPLTDFTTTDSGTHRTVTDLGATQANKYYRVAITRP